MRPAHLLAPVLALTALSFSPALSQQTPPQLAAGAERVRGGMFDASDPAGLARFLEKTGYRVELSRDEKGDPVISGRISRTDYIMQFYECESGAFCNSVQLHAHVRKPPAVTLETLNAFNTRWRYARATLQGEEVHLQMDVNLDAGVTADNLEDTLDIWRQLLEISERELFGLS